MFGNGAVYMYMYNGRVAVEMYIEKKEVATKLMVEGKQFIINTCNIVLFCFCSL